MERLAPGLNIKLLATNVRFDLIQAIKQLATKRNVSQAFLINEIFTTYFELLKEVPEVNYEN